MPGNRRLLPPKIVAKRRVSINCHINTEWTEVDVTNIHVSDTTEKRDRTKFASCADIGDPRSVIGGKKLNRMFPTTDA